VDGQVFEDMKAAIVKDRYAYFKDFLDNFYNVDVLAPDRISDEAWQASFNVAVGSSPYATYACVNTWLTDFRDDLPKIDVPTLVVHGTEDRILPFEATAARLGELIADVTVVPVECGPAQHGLDAPPGGQRSADRLPRGHHSCPGIRRMTEQTMEFLVEFEVNVPDAVSATEVEVRESAETSAAARLVHEGHLVRLWTPSAAPGETKALRLYRADSEAQLAGLVGALPLYDWMQIRVTPLAPPSQRSGVPDDRLRQPPGVSHEQRSPSRASPHPGLPPGGHARPTAGSRRQTATPCAERYVGS
jgi:muconolactone delta-isomerase